VELHEALLRQILRKRGALTPDEFAVVKLDSNGGQPNGKVVAVMPSGTGAMSSAQWEFSFLFILRAS